MQSIEIVSLIVAIASAAAISVTLTVLFRYYVRTSMESVVSGEADIEIIDEFLIYANELSRKRRIKSRVKTIVFVVLLVLLVPIFLFSLISRIAGGRPVLGNGFMVVASDSMSRRNAENAYLFENNLKGQFQKFDIIVLKSVDSPEQLEQYDIVAYRNDGGRSIIHRIVDVTGEGDNVRYSMRGDANNANDTYHPTFEDVLGVYKGTRVRFLGVIVLFMQSIPGIITVIAILYCLFMADYMERKAAECKDARCEQLKSAIFDLPEGRSLKEVNYNGFVYRFDENGFADKTEAETSEEGTMTKLFDNSEQQKIIIKKRENDGKDQ